MAGLLRSAAAFAALLLVSTSLLTTAGCNSGTSPAPPAAQEEAAPTSGPRFVILMNGDSPFWDAVRVGMNEAAKKFGVNAVLETNDGTPRGQIDKLRQLSSQTDIAAVAISATDAGNVAIADELRELLKRGVKVITIDSDVDRSRCRDARLAFVGTDNLAGGKALGACAKALRPDGGAYVQFVGRTGAQNAIERMDGFQEGAGEKLVERDRMGDDTNRSTARDNVRNAIRNHPDLNVLVGIWSYNAPAIADVVRELGVRDKMAVVVFDAEPLAIEQVAKGEIDAMVVQNPFEMGYQGIRLMKSLVEGDLADVSEMLPNYGKSAQGDLYDTGLKVVVPDQGSQLTPDLFDAKCQYMKLGEFRQWLDKYGLKGS